MFWYFFRLGDDPSFHVQAMKKLNLQSFRFGGQKWQALNVTEEFRALDQEFDLMAITEQFEESSILLSKELCWPLQDFAALNKKVRLEANKVYDVPINTIISFVIYSNLFMLFSSR